MIGRMMKMSDFDLSVQLNEVHKSETDFLEDLSNSVYKKYHVIPYIAEGVGYSNNCIYKPTARISISGISAEEIIFTRALKQMNIPKAFCTTRRNRQIVILLYLLNNSIVCFEAENTMFVITKNKELAYQYFRGKVSMEKFCNHFYSTQEELESGQFGCYILSQSSQENIERMFFDIRQPYVISPYETTHKLIAAFQQMIIRNIACVHFVNWERRARCGTLYI